MTSKEIIKLIDDTANTLFRCPDGWPSMEQHHLPGTPPNLIFLNTPQRTNWELITAMRESYKKSVKVIIGRVMGVDLE